LEHIHVRFVPSPACYLHYFQDDHISSELVPEFFKISLFLLSMVLNTSSVEEIGGEKNSAGTESDFWFGF
jgi:hypothetical protein